jgi:tetratricopeptide (TPR) repeat protein
MEFDPGGAVTTIAVRLALMERDYDEAEHQLGTCGQLKFNDFGLAGFAGALDDYTVPRDWYVGLIARGRGNERIAGRAFEAAREVVKADLACSPDEPKTLIMLGLINAMLRRAEDAIAAAERAVQLLPISADALDGPLVAINLAVIYAQLDHSDRALRELERLVRLPGGPTLGTLRIEPLWDPLRAEPRFQKLLGV